MGHAGGIRRGVATFFAQLVGSKSWLVGEVILGFFPPKIGRRCLGCLSGAFSCFVLHIPFQEKGYIAVSGVNNLWFSVIFAIVYPECTRCANHHGEIKYRRRNHAAADKRDVLAARIRMVKSNRPKIMDLMGKSICPFRCFFMFFCVCVCVGGSSHGIGGVRRHVATFCPISWINKLTFLKTLFGCFFRNSVDGI